MLRSLLAGFSLLIFQHSVSASPFPLTLIETFDDDRVVIYASESDINNAPDWQPAEGAPPLSVKKLIDDINDWRTRNPEFRDATISEFELKPIRNHEKQHRWYYLVQIKNAGSSKADEHYLAVLMNGKVLPAIKEPAAYK